MKMIHHRRITAMIKKQQKWIALLVTLTFIWLLQFSAMPLAANGTAEQVSAFHAGQGPGHYEAIGQNAAPAKKKSILPFVLIGVGALAVTAAVLFLFVLNQYDITGSWDFKFTWSDLDEEFTVTFSGKKKSGTWQFVEDPLFNGTYAVKGKEFTTTLSNTALATEFSGKFTDKDAMSGTWTIYGNIWNWTATRLGTAATAKRAPAQKKTSFR
jgi:hypothetical protein